MNSENMELVPVESPTKKRKREEEMKAADESWAQKAKKEKIELATRLSVKMAELKGPWLQFLDPYLWGDPAQLVLGYMIDDVCQITEEPCPYPETDLPILLLFYGDHDEQPFLHFVQNIIADGDTKPLSKVLLDPIRKYFPQMRMKHFLGNEYNTSLSEKMDERVQTSWTMMGARPGGGHELRWAHPEGRHLMIKFTFGGQKYIACEARSRQAYRWIDNRVCDTGRSTDAGQIEKEWRCKHSVVMGYYLRNIKDTLAREWFPMTLETWNREPAQLHPSNWFDVLYCMKLKRAPHSLWYALIPSSFYSFE